MNARLCTVLLVILSGCASAPSAPNARGPIALFDGHGLDGWHTDVPAADGGAQVPPSFFVRDGLLVSTASPRVI